MKIFHYVSKMRIQLLLCCAIILPLISNAQKLGDIDEGILKTTLTENIPDAGYEYLLNNSHTYYDIYNETIEMVTEYHVRIKIHSKVGVESADVAIRLSKNGRDKEKIARLKAYSYNYENGEVNETKLEKKDIFEKEYSDYSDMVTFAIPNVREGSIIEYSYQIQSPFLYSTPKHSFQFDAPVRFSEFVLDIPEYFVMQPVATGLVPLQREEDDFFGDFNGKRYIFVATDVPAILEDDYVLNVDDYRSSLKYELHTVKIPGAKIQEYSKDWFTIGNNLLDYDSFGNQLKKRVKVDILDEIEGLPDKEKLMAIYQFVVQNVTFNDYTGYSSNSIKKALKNKEGTSADINLLFINLCRAAGLDAHPVVTMKRSDGYLNQLYPSLDNLNYVFGVVVIDGATIFVDATDPNFIPGNLPLRAMNKNGLLVLKDNSQIISIPNQNLNYNLKAGKYIVNVDEEKLEGSGKVVLKNYGAIKARLDSKKEDDQDFLDDEDLQEDEDSEGNDEGDGEDEESDEVMLEDNFVYSDVSGYDNPFENIKTNFEAELYSPITKIGDEVYIDAFVTFKINKNPFVTAVREYPAFFNSLHDINHISILHIPEGYRLKNVPETKVITLEGGKGEFSYKVSEGLESLTINCSFKVNDDIFTPNDFTSLYNFFDMIIEMQKEKIVLEKI